MDLSHEPGTEILSGICPAGKVHCRFKLKSNTEDAWKEHVSICLTIDKKKSYNRNDGK